MTNGLTINRKFHVATIKGRETIKEAEVRLIAKTLDWKKQRQMWRSLRQRSHGSTQPSD